MTLKLKTALLSTISFLATAPLALAHEVGIDRPGSDLRPGFELSQNDPNRCKQACENDRACKAYTYVRPGNQGPSARCWLKSTLPSPERNDCCVSEIRGLNAERQVADRLETDTTDRQVQVAKGLAEIERIMTTIYDAMYALLQQQFEVKKDLGEAMRAASQRAFEAQISACKAKIEEIEQECRAAEENYITACVMATVAAVSAVSTASDTYKTLHASPQVDVQRVDEMLLVLKGDIATRHHRIEKVRKSRGSNNNSRRDN